MITQEKNGSFAVETAQSRVKELMGFKQTWGTPSPVLLLVTQRAG